MKTPRELLLERNSGALSDLDRIRRDVVGGLDEKKIDDGRMPSFLSWLATPWRELVAPSRYAWAAIVAAWIVILVANFLMSSQPRNAVADAKRNRDDVSAPCLMTMIQERQREVSEFFGSSSEPRAATAAPPRRESRRDQSGAAWLALDARRIA